jgi:hypothetical protein
MMFFVRVRLIVLLSLLLIGLPACQEKSRATPTAIGRLPAGFATPAVAPPTSALITPVVTSITTGVASPPQLAAPPATPTPAEPGSPAVATEPAEMVTTYYVATDGRNEGGDGSAERPWASITHALRQVPDGAIILVQPGTYEGQVELLGRFEQGVIVRAAEPYLVRLRDDHTVVICFTCAGITLEGFDIAHEGSDADRYVIQIQDVEGDGEGGRRVTLRNNIIHDSRNNDLLKVNNGADAILISSNVFYNMGGPYTDNHLDINSATNVIVEDNIFFNDFEASGRDNDNDTGSFVVIKDSNRDDDANLGSHHIIVRRNVFLNWQGRDDDTFIVVGEDSVDYVQASDVLIENNLLIGNSPNEIFRHNTIVGDLPARTFALRLARNDDNPPNDNISFYNNIWSDPTGTMGAEDEDDANDFSDSHPDDTNQFLLLNNLYWNGGAAIPTDEEELVNYTDDAQAVVADPQLGEQGDVHTPVWRSDEQRFADGSATIREAFERLVMAYGYPAAGSAAIDAAVSPTSAEPGPADDILGRPRQGWGNGGDIGAVEVGPP